MMEEPAAAAVDQYDAPYPSEFLTTFDYGIMNGEDDNFAYYIVKNELRKNYNFNRQGKKYVGHVAHFLFSAIYIYLFFFLHFI